MRRVVARTRVIDHFPVYGEDGFTKVAGLGAEAFEVVVFRDGEVEPLLVEIDEIAASPGEYRMAFTPGTAGFHEVEVVYPAGKQVYAEQYEVFEPVVVGSHRPPGGV